MTDSDSEIMYFVEWEYVHFTLLKQVNQICMKKLMHVIKHMFKQQNFQFFNEQLHISSTLLIVSLANDSKYVLT
jgi:hypothetical protein